MDFRYLAQAPVVDETTCNAILASLKEFHDHKAAVLNAGARVGKGGKPINNWYIPKLELLQCVVPSIRANGAPIQWSADITEHAHITEIKNPASASNNQNYDPQICRSLDRLDKCRRFDLATSVREAWVEFGPHLEYPVTDEDEDEEGPENKRVHTAASLALNIRPVSDVVAGPRLLSNYFEEADCLKRGEDPRAPRPFRTFAVASTAFHLTRDPPFKQMLVDDVAAMFQLPDLRPALADYLQRLKTHESSLSVGGRRIATPGSQLPFDKLQVWPRIRIQTKAIHHPNNILPPQTLNVCPPSKEWPHGRYDAVLVNIDHNFTWPKSRLNGKQHTSYYIAKRSLMSTSGHIVAEIRLIMRAVLSQGSRPIRGLDSFISYVQRFDVVPQLASGLAPDPVSEMYALKRSTRSDGTRMGDVVPVAQFRVPIPLDPRFGQEANSRLSKETSPKYTNEFWLNKYFDKDIYYAFHH